MGKLGRELMREWERMRERRGREGRKIENKRM